MYSSSWNVSNFNIDKSKVLKIVDELLLKLNNKKIHGLAKKLYTNY